MDRQKELINNYFSWIRDNNTKVDSFFSFLDSNEIHYAVLGGSIRAAINNNLIPRDIDIVFETNNIQIQNYLIQNNIAYKKNYFDGLKFNLNNIQFDVWNIKNHFAFRENYYEPQFENICKTTFLNYDSIMFDFTKQILYSEAYQTCIDNKKIDLIGKMSLNNNNPNCELSICKIFELKKKQGLSLSEKTKKYIKKYCKSCKNEKACMITLQEAYEKHYNKKMNNNLSIYIRNKLKEICYS